jgi:hypothetical protein
MPKACVGDNAIQISMRVRGAGKCRRSTWQSDVLEQLGGAPRDVLNQAEIISSSYLLPAVLLLSCAALNIRLYMSQIARVVRAKIVVRGDLGGEPYPRTSSSSK